MGNLTLMSAAVLRDKQQEYARVAENRQMSHIIESLNSAYMSTDRYQTFSCISEGNIRALEQAGYKVEYFSDQREGSWYKVSW